MNHTRSPISKLLGNVCPSPYGWDFFLRPQPDSTGQTVYVERWWRFVLKFLLIGIGMIAAAELIKPQKPLTVPDPLDTILPIFFTVAGALLIGLGSIIGSIRRVLTITANTVEVRTSIVGVSIGNSVSLKSEAWVAVVAVNGSKSWVYRRRFFSPPSGFFVLVRTPDAQFAVAAAPFELHPRQVADDFAARHALRVETDPEMIVKW